jgi:hypothetical protein
LYINNIQLTIESLLVNIPNILDIDVRSY